VVTGKEQIDVTCSVCTLVMDILDATLTDPTNEQAVSLFVWLIFYTQDKYYSRLLIHLSYRRSAPGESSNYF
jgi:hypothetical protein